MSPDDVASPRLRLVLLHYDLIAAILRDDRAGAETLLNASLPPGWPDEDDRWLLELRQRQMREDAESAPWLLRAIMVQSISSMVGHIGFHGPPDQRGFVEVGYAVVPEHRRCGYAQEALDSLVAAARETGLVHGLRASVAPDNQPSLALISKLGFVQTGVQWDERDGEELVFEVDLA